jgi:hypothetical protein
LKDENICSGACRNDQPIIQNAERLEQARSTVQLLLQGLFFFLNSLHWDVQKRNAAAEGTCTGSKMPPPQQESPAPKEQSLCRSVSLPTLSRSQSMQIATNYVENEDIAAKGGERGKNSRQKLLPLRML